VIEIGQRAEVRRTYRAGELAELADLAGATAEGNTVPEPLIAALFSYLLGVKLPGNGTNYLKQELEFLAPAPLGAELVASVEVSRLRPEKHLVDLATLCKTADGDVVAQGRALVLVKDVGKSSGPSR
jgi:acyl dehydratase